MRKNKNLAENLLSFFESIGNFSMMSFDVFKLLFSGKIHFRNTIQQLAFIGTDSLPIVILTGASIGMVFALQVTGLFQRYGANSMVGAAVGLAIVRELAPLFTGVVIAGRIGAAITAEIGSMKVTEQIDAMKSMAVNPLGYLAVPRVLSCLIMVPLLTVIAVVVGISGGMLVAVYVKKVILIQYIESVKDFLVPMDIVKAMIKSAFFGMLVALISCFKGINTGEGAQGVGISTTGAVVTSLISIFITNYLLSLVLFASKT
ncbi:MAG: ABC transporter permease [Candidatus Sericytochromatia bacterium]